MDKEEKKRKPNNLGSSNAEKPISLKPYKFNEAISDLLKVKPEAKKNKNETDKCQ